MPDSSQVIRALECFADPDVFTREKCFDCPYKSVDCELSVMRDALELLKAQKQVPTCKNNFCPEGNKVLKGVKWDG